MHCGNGTCVLFCSLLCTSRLVWRGNRDVVRDTTCRALLDSWLPYIPGSNRLALCSRLYNTNMNASTCLERRFSVPRAWAGPLARRAPHSVGGATWSAAVTGRHSLPLSTGRLRGIGEGAELWSLIHYGLLSKQRRSLVVETVSHEYCGCLEQRCKHTDI